MDLCPFCGVAVSEELVAFGGTCPKCFAEIPGEEAVTDPGDDVRAAQDRSDRRRVAVRAVLGLLTMLLVVGCTGMIAAAVVLRPTETAALIDFDTFEYALPEVTPEEPVPVPDPVRRPPPTVAPQPDVAVAKPPPRPAVGGTPAPEVARGGAMDLSITPVAVRRDDTVVLDDSLAIRDMIGEEMRAGIPQLVNCYNRRLKQEPTLKGRWRVTFTVNPEGRAVDATAVGLDGADQALEACLVSHIEREWTFGRIAQPSPVAKTLTFRANP